MAFSNIENEQTDGGVFTEDGQYAFTPTVSMLAEVPESLHSALRSYIDQHANWDQDRVFTAALSLFLLQNGNLPSEAERPVAQTYINSLFQEVV